MKPKFEQYRNGKWVEVENSKHLKKKGIVRTQEEGPCQEELCQEEFYQDELSQEYFAMFR